MFRERPTPKAANAWNWPNSKARAKARRHKWRARAPWDGLRLPVIEAAGRHIRGAFDQLINSSPVDAKTPGGRVSAHPGVQEKGRCFRSAPRRRARTRRRLLRASSGRARNEDACASSKRPIGSRAEIPGSTQSAFRARKYPWFCERKFGLPLHCPKLPSSRRGLKTWDLRSRAYANEWGNVACRHLLSKMMHE